MGRRARATSSRSEEQQRKTDSGTDRSGTKLRSSVTTVDTRKTQLLSLSLSHSLAAGRGRQRNLSTTTSPRNSFFNCLCTGEPREDALPADRRTVIVECTRQDLSVGFRCVIWYPCASKKLGRDWL